MGGLKKGLEGAKDYPKPSPSWGRGGSQEKGENFHVNGGTVWELQIIESEQGGKTNWTIVGNKEKKDIEKRRKGEGGCKL